MFYSPQEPHCNKSYAPGSKIFHVEISKNWFDENELQSKEIKTDEIEYAKAKNIFTHIIEEFFLKDDLSEDSIGNLLLYLWNLLVRTNEREHYVPYWVKQFNKIKDEFLEGKPTLISVAKELNMHPVTLSKQFPRYYHCSFGAYIREMRIEKSLPLLAKKNMPVNDVAFLCGFDNTSNFIRTFKKVKGTTPIAYRNLL